MTADANALAGLRRLVLHAHDLLIETGVMDPVTYHPNAGQRAASWAAQALAVQVLQLVADCLPQDDGQSADSTPIEPSR